MKFSFFSSTLSVPSFPLGVEFQLKQFCSNEFYHENSGEHFWNFNELKILFPMEIESSR